MLDYFVVGVNHKTAAVALREKLHFTPEETLVALKKIIQRSSVEEVIILSTCNRVEIIGICPQLGKIKEILTHFLAGLKRVAMEELQSAVYCYQRKEAVQHVFRVAASLDSMIVGEPQILGQIKQAMKIGQDAETCNKNLSKLLSESLHVAKKIRSETNIAAHAVSVSFAAVEKAKEILPRIDNADILVLGTGKMGLLALKHLNRIVTNGSIFITNRTDDKADQIAREFGGTAVEFKAFPDLLGRVDIILSSTASSDFVLTKDQILKHRVLSNGNAKPLYIIDMAVPRDVEPSINTMEGIYLHDIDALRCVVDKNLQKRQGEAHKANAIIDKAVERFDREIRLQAIKPLIISLQQWFESVRQDELNRHQKDLAKLSDAEKELIEHITQAIVKRLMHTPLCSIRTELHPNQSLPTIEVISKVFGLDGITELVCFDENEAEE